MCPFRGDEEVREIPDPDFQGVDWLSVRPKVRSAPTIVRRGGKMGKCACPLSSCLKMDRRL